MYKAIDIANYVLGYYSFKKKLHISNFKLQKILYFLQADCLMEKRQPLFEDEIEACDYGLVIFNVYNRFRIYANGSICFNYIDSEKKYEEAIYDADKIIINEMLDELEEYSSACLLNIIYKQKPWQDAYYGLKPDSSTKKLITNKMLYEFFSG